MIDRLLLTFGLVRVTRVRDTLHYARSVGKRLDEHRELVEQIEGAPDFLEKRWWVRGHLATQDDYLMRLYHHVYGEWPSDDAEGGWQATKEYVRPRPAILGPSCLLTGK